jgi:hypothetical protein
MKYNIAALTMGGLLCDFPSRVDSEYPHAQLSEAS